ncbi:transcription termination factor 2, mitochondrial [Gadus chalcogrammus]|uniref:transcription termination factor 2, mitochondrial n=1 Tax=Gadus chalcogrammus TaxID=1042646 RepID=UPI0024C4BE9B|nr:transcription termination factor 2, mitochondrial [Gadus chalcogrammus]
MWRLITSLCLRHPRGTAIQIHERLCTTQRAEENRHTVEALYLLSVDIQKVRKLKCWILYQTPTYVNEVAELMREMGASGSIVAGVLTQYPEAVLCHPEQMQAQRDLWLSVCPNHRELVGVIEKFPASFFTCASHHANQRANITYFRQLNLNKRIITKLMSGAPMSFSRPVDDNKKMIQTLQAAYLELGGKDTNVKIWLQKLLSQNPFVLLKDPELLRHNFHFLTRKGFTTSELLGLLSKLRGFVTELNPDAMQRTLAFSQRTLGCSDDQLRHVVLDCPALLYHSEVVLAQRFQGLSAVGISAAQILQAPTVLELTTEIVNHRVQSLRSHGYDIQTGGLAALCGTKKDFEASYGRLQLRRERPMFNPVAPLRTDD